MFGTLVVCLASEHQGGQIVLSHDGKEVTFATADNSTFGQSHIAWFGTLLTV